MPSPLRKMEGAKEGLPVFNVPVESIVVRPGFNRRETLEVEPLKNFLRVHGTKSLTPLRVCKEGDTLFLIMGHRRLQAVKELIAEGEPILRIPVQLETETDQAKLLALSMAENHGLPETQREQGQGYERLVNFGWDIPLIAHEIGVSTTHIYDCLTMLKADMAVKTAIDTKVISQSDGVKIIRTAERMGADQRDVLTQITATKVDKRRKEAKAQPVPLQAARALTPLVEKYGIALLQELLTNWPYSAEEDSDAQ